MDNAKNNAGVQQNLFYEPTPGARKNELPEKDVWLTEN